MRRYGKTVTEGPVAKKQEWKNEKSSKLIYTHDLLEITTMTVTLTQY